MKQRILGCTNSGISGIGINNIDGGNASSRVSPIIDGGSA